MRTCIDTIARAALLALVVWALVGCQTLYPDAQVQFPVATAPAAAASSPAAWDAVPTVAQPAAQPPAQANGAIYQAAQYRPLLEDHRARRVGDTLTVQIVERGSATQKSASSTSRSGSVGASGSAFPLLSAEALAKLSVGGDANNTYSGKGAAESTHGFTGSITATVVAVLANGHLVVAGEKQIGVDRAVDVLRFSGQVDPHTIRPGNTVASTQIANVRIEQRAQGAIGDAQAMGWFGRFFLNLSPL